MRNKNKFTFYMPIYGIVFTGTHQLGSFELCDKNTFLSRIENDKIRNQIACGEESNYYVSFSVFAIDCGDAINMAYKKSSEFKRMMDFCCGRNNSIPAVNLYRQNPQSERMLILSNDINNVGVHEEMNNNYIPVNHTLDEFLEEMRKNKTMYVWDLYAKENKTDKESRILNAILWVGKAHIELDNKIYFLELCFALESLLQVDTDKFINPSITYSISSNCAMIIADKYEDRKNVMSKLKQLYSIRSKLAHGKNSDVSNWECEQLFMYISYLLDDLANKEIWKQYSSMHELMQEIENQKLGKLTDCETDSIE